MGERTTVSRTRASQIFRPVVFGCLDDVIGSPAAHLQAEPQILADDPEAEAGERAAAFVPRTMPHRNCTTGRPSLPCPRDFEGRVQFGNSHGLTRYGTARHATRCTHRL